MFDFNLTRVKGRVKVVNTFEFTFDSSQRYMQRRHIFDVFLMRIKCVVKNVIIFDLIFDTNQIKSKSNFSCSAKDSGKVVIITGNNQITWVVHLMISIPSSLSFAKLVMMSSTPAKSAGDARYVSQDPFSCCPIQSRLQFVLGVRSFLGPGRTRANFVYLSDTLSTRTAK